MKLSDVRSWDAHAAGELEASLASRAASLKELRERFGRATNYPLWQGAAATEARRQFAKTGQELAGDFARVSVAHAAVRDVGAGMSRLQVELRDLDRQAATLGARLGDDGKVRFLGRLVVKNAEAAEAKEIEAKAAALVAEANALDSSAEQAFATAAQDRAEMSTASAEMSTASAASAAVPSPASAIPSPPGSGATPKDNAAWWQSLNPAQQQDVTANHPDWIGNRDGISATARDQANRTLLPLERARLAAERDQLEHDLAQPFGGLFNDKQQQLWYTEQKLKDLDAVEQTTTAHPDLKLLLLDERSGNYSKVAIAAGDPSTADHISITTSGSNNILSDIAPEFLWEKDNTPETRVEAFAHETEHLREQSQLLLANAGEAKPSVSTIVWLGGESPQSEAPNLVDSISGALANVFDSDARASAKELSSFYQGIDAAWLPTGEAASPHITALGHSYGAITTSLALQQTPSGVVTDAIFYGDPGIEVRTSAGPSQLHLEPGHVYTERTDSDRVVFGLIRPVTDIIFGTSAWDTPWATRLSSNDGIGPGDGVEHESALGHDYANTYDSDSDSSRDRLYMAGYNLAAVIAGLPNLTTPYT